MHQCEFIANFDTDEMLFPSTELRTMEGLIKHLEDVEKRKRGWEDLPDAYIFQRFFFPNSEDQGSGL